MTPFRRQRALAIAAAAVALSTAACGDNTPNRVQDTAGASASPGATTIDAPRIDWDAPLANPLPADQTTAKSVGQLAIDPQMPRLDRPPAGIQVTDPRFADPEMRGIAYVYDFPKTPANPSGRVVVIETPTDQTVQIFVGIAHNRQGRVTPTSGCRLIQVASETALLTYGSNVGRVSFIRNGVMYDVTGPTITPQLAEEMAQPV